VIRVTPTRACATSWRCAATCRVVGEIRRSRRLPERGGSVAGIKRICDARFRFGISREASDLFIESMSASSAGGEATQGSSPRSRSSASRTIYTSVISTACVHAGITLRDHAGILPGSKLAGAKASPPTVHGGLELGALRRARRRAATLQAEWRRRSRPNFLRPRRSARDAISIATRCTSPPCLCDRHRLGLRAAWDRALSGTVACPWRDEYADRGPRCSAEAPSAPRARRRRCHMIPNYKRERRAARSPLLCVEPRGGACNNDLEPQPAPAVARHSSRVLHGRRRPLSRPHFSSTVDRAVRYGQQVAYELNFEGARRAAAAITPRARTVQSFAWRLARPNTRTASISPNLQSVLSAPPRFRTSFATYVRAVRTLDGGADMLLSRQLRP